MKNTRDILRRIVVLLAAAEAAYWLYVSYFGFSIARAFHAEWLFTNWSQSAVSAALGLLFALAAVGVWRSAGWARALAVASFGASFALIAYDAIEYSYYWSHFVLAAVAVLGLLFAVSRGSAAAVGKA